MIALIKASVRNRFLVLFFALLLAFWGAVTILRTPVDALPDLSDVQVIIKTDYAGQAPEIVENQVTYPISTAMLSVPGAASVRGFSSFGTSFVYVIFEDGTDLYWARSRVLESLSGLTGSLPQGVSPELGPDATGVGWVYEYALVDRTGKHDLESLRALEDWVLRYDLKTIPGVAEVASVGGAVKEFQILPDPVKLEQYGVTIGDIKTALSRSNSEMGGGSVELAGSEVMVRARGYLRTLDDFRHIVLKANASGVPTLLSDVAQVRTGPEMRRGIAELNGEGEVAGGVVIIRKGANAKEVISAVRERLDEIKPGLPEGVEIVPVYDRSDLIDRVIHNLTSKLIEEAIVVALVCGIFLWHLRSALVAIITLPLGLCFAFIAIHFQGIEATLMSLGGIAIAVGAMVDGAIVMIESAHKKIEDWERDHPGDKLEGEPRWALITSAATEVGPAIFLSLLIITLSFIPIFTLEGQEGRLFGPLAWTKTWSMAGAALLSITLVPVLMGYWIRGRIPPEEKNPINRALIRGYRPLLAGALRFPKSTICAAVLLLFTALYPLERIGAEYLPQIAEGDILYMPTTLPGVSAGEAAAILQTTDRLIKSVPEVDSVFGKAGRADTATDSAPLEMLETTIHLKPESEWRPGMTMAKIIDELDSRVKLPGLASLWVPPIRARIDMVSTGVKSPIGIRIQGPSLAVIDGAAKAVEEAARKVPGVQSALAERLEGGRYVDIDIDRYRAARYGMTIGDVQDYISSAVGGAMAGDLVDGVARYPISIRYLQAERGTPEALRLLPVITPSGQRITLGDLAEVKVTSGPSMLKSEGGRPAAWIYVDARDRDMASVVDDLRMEIAKNVKLPAGVTVAFTGQYEMMEHAKSRLLVAAPMTVLIIFVLLYVCFRRLSEALLILTTLPVATVGGLWLLYLMGDRFSVAVGAGFIALAGLAAEFGVVMLVYLRHAVAADPTLANPKTFSMEALDRAIEHGAALRVRPKSMTVAVILAGLIPILLSTGAGSEVMSRIAVPMVGGMITAPLLSLFVIPAAWKLIMMKRRAL